MTTEYLRPVANGNYTGFAAFGAATDWECVDDPVGSPDDNATFVDNSLLTAIKESFVLSVFGGDGAINSVAISARVDLAPSVTNGTLALFLRIGGTDYDSDSQTLVAAGGYTDYTATWTTNPATATAWSGSDLAALEAGVNIVDSPVLSTKRITQLYAAVDYTPVTFSVDGGAEIPGVKANWQRQAIRRRDDGTQDLHPWATHTWDIASMDMATYLALQALHGQALTSLATTDIDDRNMPATYTSAILESIRGQQVGRRMTGVRVEFRVDVS